MQNKKKIEKGGQLEVTYRKRFVRDNFDGTNYREIADELGCSINCVYMYVFNMGLTKKHRQEQDQKKIFRVFDRDGYSNRKSCYPQLKNDPYYKIIW